jgi:cation-transporting ATPase 13A3/4/5
MSPENKSTLVQSFKNKKFTVLMCGDGANDCSALRAANVGVSLSIEEASIAAHFTSNVSDISCLIKLLREGKSSLITCIQTFKYMIIYSLVQFISVTLLMIVGSYLSDYQFLAVDGFIIFPLAFSLPRTEPYQKLSKHHPTDALISFPVIVSILSQCLIAFVFQFIGIKLLYDNKEKWYKKCEMTFNDDIIECPGNTVIFLISNIQYLITASVYIISKPFKKPFYTNWVLTFFLITSLFYSFKLIINPDYYSSYYLQIYDWKEKEGNIKMYLVIICICNFIISYISEKIILPILIKYWNIYKHQKKKENKNKDIEYTLNELQIINEE